MKRINWIARRWPAAFPTLVAAVMAARILCGAELSDAGGDEASWMIGEAIEAPQESPQGMRRSRESVGVYKARIEPHWLGENTRFWYRNSLRDGAQEFILVDAKLGIRRPAFDHVKLAAALSTATGKEFKADRLPFSEIEFVENGTAVTFEAVGRRWKCDLGSYMCRPLVLLSAGLNERGRGERESEAEEGGGARSGRPEQLQRGRRGGRFSSSDRPVVSPDGQWSARVVDHNVMIRREPDGEEFRISEDGAEGKSYVRLEWSPDSAVLVAWRVEAGDRKEVYLIRSSPPGGGRAELVRRSYALPGDKFDRHELNLFHPGERRQIKPEVDRFEHGWEAPRLRWRHGGRELAYTQVDRGHQRLRVFGVDARTGAVRTIIDERSETFIWTAHKENVWLDYVNWLEKTEEIIYASERDGWRHLYLVDADTGEFKNRITGGEWVVRGIDRIDEENRQIWFRASGMNPDQDPYFIHYYRVNFDGTGLVALTEGNGTHSIEFSPDRQFIIDTYSRVDMPPVNELRRTSDGALVCKLEEADISELRSEGWEPPEVFVAKGRDSATDIWGIICRPKEFDPSRKYPVIEYIYAGPHGSFVPKSFSPIRRFASLTDLGFVVVQIDGMGTANRSKAFHDVCWKNLKDAGFPDRILWHRAAAEKYSWYDVSRVGIYGNSAGGQNAAAGVLFHPEFYRAAVASCGCHDNRMDKASWNEQWMGYPVGPQYAESSNIENAARLQGKLLLIVGEMDTNVPPESTVRFADALIRAGKDFDFLLIPNGGHGMGEYGQRRMQDFFVRHLLGVEPPDRNRPVQETAGR